MKTLGYQVEKMTHTVLHFPFILRYTISNKFVEFAFQVLRFIAIQSIFLQKTDRGLDRDEIEYISYRLVAPDLILS